MLRIKLVCAVSYMGYFGVYFYILYSRILYTHMNMLYKYTARCGAGGSQVLTTIIIVHQQNVLNKNDS